MPDSVHICFAKGEKCWNRFEAYFCCISCGCCSSDIETRRKNRLRVLKRQLQEQYDFESWCDDPELRALQEENIKTNIRYFKRKIRYYEKVIAKGE